MAGYSETPLAKRLGFKPGDRIILINEPIYYHDLFEELPTGLLFTYSHEEKADIVHWFIDSLDDFSAALPSIIKLIGPGGNIWISWPKRSSGVKTDLSENIVRDAVLPLGLVDVKVCAVDEKWSALKIVWRKENRSTRPGQHSITRQTININNGAVTNSQHQTLDVRRLTPSVCAN